MCCDTVNRGVAYADGKIFLAKPTPTSSRSTPRPARRSGRSKNGDPKKGETMTAGAVVVKDKVIVGICGGEFGVRGHVTAYDLETASRSGAPIRSVPTTRLMFDPAQDHGASASRSARTRRSRPGRATSGRSAAARPGAGTPTIRELNLIYYGTGNPEHLEPGAARPGGQQVVDDDLRA